MTKKNVLKLATLAFVLFLSVNAVNSQILTDYQDVGETVYQTTGKDFRLYVLPDLLYSPGYNATTNQNLGVNSRWTWEWTIDASAGPGKAAENENWVQINDPAIGTYVFTVKESNTAFGCGDDIGTTKTVEVIDVPYARFDITDAETFMGLENVLATGCETVETAINAVFANADEDYPYNINLGYTVHNATLNGSGEIELGGLLETLSYTEASPLVVSDTELIASTDFALRNNLITVYQFQLTGWNAQISRKSDYLDIVTDAAKSLNAPGDYTYYNIPQDDVNDVLTAYVVVLPAPSTGPIYHIPNNFNGL